MPDGPKEFRSQPFKNKGRYVLGTLLLLGGAWAVWHRQSDRHAPHQAVQLSQSSLSKASLAPPPSSVSPQSIPALPPHAGCFTPPTAAEAPAPPAGLSGQLGLWVAQYDPQTARVMRAVASNPDSVFPLASSYKQAVLWAVLRAVDQGKMALSERFTVTQGTQSLGDYPFDGSTLTQLMTRMIHNSDNTATDLLHRRVGLQAVQAVADGLNLCQTRIILPTKDWWVAESGLDPNFPGAAAFERARGSARDAIAAQLDARAQQLRADVVQHALDLYLDKSYQGADDLGTHNVSTPAEFGQLIAHEFLKSGLTPASQAIQRQMMATGFGRSRLAFKTIDFGGKGGNAWRILTMTGYAVTPQDQHLVYVFMQRGSDQTYTLPKNRLAFAWVNAAVRQLLSEPPQ